MQGTSEPLEANVAIARGSGVPSGRQSLHQGGSCREDVSYAWLDVAYEGTMESAAR